MARSQRKGNGLPAQLAAVNLHAAGIDIGSQEHWVAVPPTVTHNRCVALAHARRIWKR